MTDDLFGTATPTTLEPVALAPDAWLLPGFALPHLSALQAGLAQVLAEAPFRHMRTPRGQAIGAAMSNCGALGWISDARGYRYSAVDPDSGRSWPPFPAAWQPLAQLAATTVGFPGFEPDACLVNRYAPGVGMGLHQDRDEAELIHPIVSVSLGLPARFMFGGPRRSDRVQRMALRHGDVLVWGGGARLHHHGIAPLAAGEHPFAGACRINLTFRRAGMTFPGGS